MVTKLIALALYRRSERMCRQADRWVRDWV